MSFPLIPYIVAFASSVAAVFWFNPFRHSRRLDALVVACVFGVLGLVVGTARFVGPDGALASLGGGVLAVVPGIVVALVTVLQRRRLHWLVESVFRPTYSESRLKGLCAHLAKKKPLMRVQDARRAAWVFGTRHQYAAAAQLLSEVPLDEVHPRWRFEIAIARNDLAGYRLRLGDVDGADAALRAVSDVPSNLSGPIGTKRALLAALAGQEEAALAKLDGIALRPGSPHRSTADLAAAHAHASRGDKPRAKAALRRLAKAEPRWLERATTPPGPASALAAALAAEKDAPYR